MSRDNATSQNIRSDENFRLSPPSPVSNPNSVSPIRTRNQDIVSPTHPSIKKRGRNTEPFNASINGFFAINGHSTSYFSGIIGLGEFPREVAEVNARKRMNFANSSGLMAQNDFPSILPKN